MTNISRPIPTNFPDYAEVIKYEVALSDMGDHYITATVHIAGNIIPDFSFTWEIEFRSSRYIHYIRQPQAYKDTSTQKAIYTLVFELDFIDDMKSQYFSSYESVNTDNFQGVVVSEYTASFVGSIKMFADMLEENLNHYFSDKGYAVDLNPTLKNNTDQVVFSISDSYIWDVLQQVYATYGYRWRLETNDDGYPTIMIGYESNAIDHTFKYGFDGGLMKLERSVDETNIYNVVRGRGSSDNVPPYYFKTASGDNAENYASDPDAIPELANFYFDKIRSAQFRLYVKGWRAALYGDTLNTTMYADRDTYFAYCQGYDDGMADDPIFKPVEYIRDKDSIEMYGEKAGAIADVEEAKPSIQGMDIDGLGRVDEVVAVEEVLVDYDSASTSQYTTTQMTDASVTASHAYSAYKSTDETSYESVDSIISTTIQTIDTVGGYDVESSEIIFYFTIQGNETIWSTLNGVTDSDTSDIWDSSVSISATTGLTKTDIEVIPSSNITLEYDIDEPSAKLDFKGTIIVPTDKIGDYVTIFVDYGYKYTTFRHSSGTLHKGGSTVEISDIQLKSEIGEENIFKDTFDIWIKNIFQSTKSSSETDAEYVERMWNDVVLDDASVSFSSGDLSSADYNFLILSDWTDNIHYDTSKSIDSVDGNTYQSHWRLTLAKSTEDERSNVDYVPTTWGNAVAGDYFYLVNVQLPHFYTTYAESVVDDYIRATLAKRAQVDPTWVLTSDPVAMATKSDDAGILLEQLNIGTMITVQDHRFIDGSEQLHVSTLNLTYSRDNILPSVTLSLTDEITPQISSSDMLSAEIEALSAKVGGLITVQDIMSICDPRYLMKTGQDQKTLSKTEFDTTISSTNARQGSVAGSGWLIYTDSKGKKVIETDNLVVRNEMQVNSLVINQISVQGGKEILCAAEIECTRVDDDDTGYICYFDQKQGSVGNLFQTGDVAYSTVFNVDNTTLKYYKRMVVATDVNSITLSKDDDFVNGSGIPAEGDVICHYGSYTDSDRRYVIVRDVIGGGNEQMIMDLYSVNTDGYRYYFAGVETGQNPVWQIGDSARGGMRVEVNGNGEADNKVEVWASSFSVQSPSGEYEDVSEQIAAAQDLAEVGIERLDNIDSNTVFSISEKLTQRITWYAISGVSSTTANPTSAGSFYKAYYQTSQGNADATDFANAKSELLRAYNVLKAQLNTYQLYTDSDYTPFDRETLAGLLSTYYQAETDFYYVVSKGNNGADGEKGDKGEDGADGLNGLNGTDGVDGLNGTNGTDGQDGADGQTSYFHIAYADSATGSGFSQYPTGKDYIGTYVDFTEGDADSTSNLWKWQLVKGADGADGSQGIPGTNGADGVTYYLHIAYADDAYGNGFNTADATDKTYIGTYTDTNIDDASAGSSLWKWAKIKGADGTDGQHGADGADGVDGKSIEFIFTRQASDVAPSTPLSEDTDDFVPDGWTDDQQGVNSMLQYEFVSKRVSVNGSWGVFSTPSLWARYSFDGSDGADGVDGLNGTDGQDGTDGADGQDGVDGKSYEYIFKQQPSFLVPTQPDSNNIDEYLPDGWSDDPLGVSSEYPYEWVAKRVKINGLWSAFSSPTIWARHSEDGADGADGQDGSDGQNGADGRSIVPLYALSDTAPTIPSGRVSTLPTGWATSVNNANYVKTMVGVSGDWLRDDFLFDVGDIYEYVKRTMRLTIYVPSDIAYPVDYSISTYGILRFGNLDTALTSSNEKLSLTGQATSSTTYLLSAGTHFIDIEFSRDGSAVTGSESVEIEIYGGGELDSAATWVSQALYDSTAGDYEFTDPYKIVEPSPMSFLEQTYAEGSATIKGGAVLAGAIVLSTNKDAGNTTDEEISGVLVGYDGDDIAMAFDKSSAYEKAASFTQGETLATPNTLITRDGNLYINSAKLGRDYGDQTVVTEFGTLTASNGLYSAQTALPMPDLTEAAWRSSALVYSLINRSSALTATATSLDASIELASDPIILNVPSQIAFTIWMQGDIRKYTVQKYNDSNQWVDLWTGYLDVRPSGIGASISVFVLNGLYRINFEATSYGLDGSLVPQIVHSPTNSRSLASLPIDGMFIYGNGYINVYTNETYGRSVYGLRGGNILNYQG